MNNNYEYVQSLKKNKEEQEKIKKQLQKTLDILLIPEEEKEQLLSSVIDNAINSYTQNTLFPFLRYVKIKLKKEIEKKIFYPFSTYFHRRTKNNKFIFIKERRTISNRGRNKNKTTNKFWYSVSNNYQTRKYRF